MTVPPPQSAEAQRLLRLAKLFDLRTFIGTLFTIFGVLVTIQGLFVSDADVRKASGVHLALWLGLIMLAIGIGFIGWMLAKPPELSRAKGAEDSGSDAGPGRGGH
jgi:hypothetical protein